ncbi:hypothetical protein QEH68_09715 [Paenarthrobacter sp. OM7]|uniref:Uncharacterized protein n=1 Tax=Paenarthrobacter sp. AMU7 TaxID=3162492 RepID=A0AB39YVD5_9MICC|nr:hypothetical protein [Paenarthrobacter sp. OM7]WGM22420.1 hypothetical protein QEH68_09715 [Paenarthrobacter sp. OM7]
MPEGQGRELARQELGLNRRLDLKRRVHEPWVADSTSLTALE